MIRHIDSEKCTGCGQCFKSCSLDVFRLDTRQTELSPCMAACPAGTDIRTYNHLLQQNRLEEALEVLKTRRPDLVTLDMEMPDEWGPRFYRKMTMMPEYKDMPVIVISGLQGIHLAIRNAVASLQKPFNPEELLAIVDRVLSSDEEIRKAMDGE